MQGQTSEVLGSLNCRRTWDTNYPNRVIPTSANTDPPLASLELAKSHGLIVFRYLSSNGNLFYGFIVYR